MLFVPSRSRESALRTERLADVQRERQEKLGRHEALFKEKDVAYTVLMKDGDPGPAILKCTNDQKTDLVILGSRGLNNL
ncbi:universal stress protein [Domibacillus iocasae]|uniref:universal stress protein n=1 Tax=Domibacillus iocasae TaxID=1714016 RepID=UPI0009F30D3C